jgi:hypothetical protein
MKTPQEDLSSLRPQAKDIEAAYTQKLLPSKAREAYERMAWALDVEVEDLPTVLARLGLPERGWILTIGLVGWRPGTTPPGAEVLAREGLVDLATRRLTKKGKVVHDALEVLVLAVLKLKRGANWLGAVDHP